MENNTNNWPIGDHLENFNNPHEVTKAQVGLGNVDNVRQYSELNPPPNHINTVCGKGPDANGDIDLVKGDVNLGKVDNVKQYSASNPPPYPVTSVNGQTGAVNIALPDTSGLQTAINTHTANVCNPHQVTKDQVGLGNVPNILPYHAGNKPGKGDVGLGNVDNTSDLDKPISTAVQSALNAKLNLAGGTVTGATNFTGALQKDGLAVPNVQSGAWTPRLATIHNGVIGSTTYSTKYNLSTYYRIGDLVFLNVNMRVDLSNGGSPIEYAAIITGLPYPPAENSLTWASSLNSLAEWWTGEQYPPNTPISAELIPDGYFFLRTTDGSTVTRWSKTNDAHLKFSLVYRTA